MKSEKVTDSHRRLIVRHFDDIPLRVPMQAYAQFTGRIDQQLRHLEARWRSHVPLAPAPHFGGVGRGVI